MGRERRVSRVLVSRIQLCYFDTGRHLTTRSDTMRLRIKCVLVRKIFCIRRPLAIQQRRHRAWVIGDQPSAHWRQVISYSHLRMWAEGLAQAGFIPTEFSTPALEQKTTRGGTVRPSAADPSRSLRRLTVDFRSEKPVLGCLSVTTRLRLVPWWRLPAGRARRPCE